MRCLRQKAVETAAVLICAALGVGAVWLAAKYLLPWLAPFLVAYALALLMELPLRFLVKHGWSRKLAAALLTLLLLGLTVWALTALTGKCVDVVTVFADEVPMIMSSVSDSLIILEERIAELVASAPAGMEETVTTALTALGDELYGLPVLLSQWALSLVSRTAQSSPDVLLFIVTAALGTYFVSASLPRTNAFLLAQLPYPLRTRLEGLGRSMRSSFGGLLRAQLILMALTFFELLIAFWVLEIRNAPAIAAVTAAVDALPVFGTGIVLIPWGLYSLLLGATPKGVGLLVSYAIVNVVQSCMQAKLVGDQIGLDPLASLLGIYVGWRVAGVWGMLLLPLLLVTMRQLNEQGVVRLWREA